MGRMKSIAQAVTESKNAEDSPEKFLDFAEMLDFYERYDACDKRQIHKIRELTGEKDEQSRVHKKTHR